MNVDRLKIRLRLLWHFKVYSIFYMWMIAVKLKGLQWVPQFGESCFPDFKTFWSLEGNMGHMLCMAEHFWYIIYKNFCSKIYKYSDKQ